MNGPTDNTAYEWKQYRFNPLPQLNARSLSMWIDMFDRGYLRQFAVLSEQIRERDDILMVDVPKRLDQAASRARQFRVQIRGDIPKNTPLYAEAEKHRQALEYCYNNLSVTDATDLNLKGGIRLLARQMLLAQFDRYAVHELVARPSARGLTFECKFVPLYFFDNTRGFLRYGGAASQLGTEPLSEEAWMVTCGLGLMKALAICQFMKGLSIKDWLNFSQNYSEPGLHLETTAAYGTPEWDEAKRGLEAFTREFRILTTSGQKFNPIEFSRTGEAPFQPMSDRMDRRMSAICRGGDMKTMSRGGADNAGASLQDDETDILNVADCELLTETLQQKIDRLVIREVFDTDEPLAEIVITPEERKDVKQMMDVDTFLLQCGARMSLQDLMQRYDRAEADKDEPELAHASKAGPAPAAVAPAEQPIAASNDRAEPDLKDLQTALKNDAAPVSALLAKMIHASDEDLPALIHQAQANYPQLLSAVLAHDESSAVLARIAAGEMLEQFKEDARA